MFSVVQQRHAMYRDVSLKLFLPTPGYAALSALVLDLLAPSRIRTQARIIIIVVIGKVLA